MNLVCEGLHDRLFEYNELLFECAIAVVFAMKLIYDFVRALKLWLHNLVATQWRDATSFTAVGIFHAFITVLFLVLS